MVYNLEYIFITSYTIAIALILKCIALLHVPPNIIKINIVKHAF